MVDNWIPLRFVLMAKKNKISKYVSLDSKTLSWLFFFTFCWTKDSSRKGSLFVGVWGFLQRLCTIYNIDIKSAHLLQDFTLENDWWGSSDWYQVLWQAPECNRVFMLIKGLFSGHEFTEAGGKMYRGRLANTSVTLCVISTHYNEEITFSSSIREDLALLVWLWSQPVRGDRAPQ